MTETQHVEWVKVGDLHLDAPYQRRLDRERAVEIAENFDPDKFTVIIISRRKDGTLWVLDGQHRVTALRHMGWDDQEVIAEIREDLSYEAEAALHVELNRNRKRPTALAEYNALLEAKEPMYVAIDKRMRDRGLTITHERGDGCVQAIGAVVAIYQRGGGEMLERTLDLIVQAWGTASDGFASDILKGLAQALALLPNLDDARLVRALSRYRPAEYVRKGLNAREVTMSHLANNITVAVVGEYNALPGGKKAAVPTQLLQPRARTMFTSKGGGKPLKPRRPKAPKASAGKKA